MGNREGKKIRLKLTGRSGGHNRENYARAPQNETGTVYEYRIALIMRALLPANPLQP